MLTNLFKAVDIDAIEAEKLTNCLVDWRDGDDSTTFPGGAESADYKSFGRSYGSKNGPLTTLAELRLILGFTPQIITAIADAVTLHGNGNNVLPDYAPPLVLTALDITTPPTPSIPPNIGGPIYRVQVKFVDEGLTQEIIFKRGGRGIAPLTVIERR
jgi:general secretion pathway protein K